MLDVEAEEGTIYERTYSLGIPRHRRLHMYNCYVALTPSHWNPKGITYLVGLSVDAEDKFESGVVELDDFELDVELSGAVKDTCCTFFCLKLRRLGGGAGLAR